MRVPGLTTSRRGWNLNIVIFTVLAGAAGACAASAKPARPMAAVTAAATSWDLIVRPPLVVGSCRAPLGHRGGPAQRAQLDDARVPGCDPQRRGDPLRVEVV